MSETDDMFGEDFLPEHVEDGRDQQEWDGWLNSPDGMIHSWAWWRDAVEGHGGLGVDEGLLKSLAAALDVIFGTGKPWRDAGDGTGEDKNIEEGQAA